MLGLADSVALDSLRGAKAQRITSSVKDRFVAVPWS